MGTLANHSLKVGAVPVTVDVSPAFRDPEGDGLSYAASSSPGNVASVAVAGSVATVTPVGAGTAVVTVTASERDGGECAGHAGVSR